METIGAMAKLNEGVTWARLYGGAVALIGALDGQELDKPLAPKRIRTFDNLRIIDRSDIQFDQIVFQLDPKKPRYGLPEFYPITFTLATGTTQVQNVHYSRIIEIHGNLVPAGATRQLTKEQRYWGISVLQNAYDHLKILGSSISSIGTLLDEVSVGKYKLADLMDILSQPDGDQLIKKRMEVMDLCRSVFRSVYMDKEDEYTRDNVQFAGVPEVLYNIYMLVAADTGYPITRLFGVSPAGMNATGESDMRNYYDKVRSAQRNIVEPLILRLVKIIAEWKNIEEPYIEWNSLEQLSEKEKAEKEKIEADKEQVVANTYQAYINAGIMEPYEARYLQFGDTLDSIPVPEEDMLPPVETLTEEQPGNENPEENNNPPDDPNAEGDPANKPGEDPDKKIESEEAPEGEEGKEKPTEEEEGNPEESKGEDETAELQEKIKAMDKEKVQARIEELEAVEKPSDKETAELKLLQGRLEEITKAEEEK
jgi:phage-related protein (TIGR01555 family)